MPLYLVRHTTPDVAQGVGYGRTDLQVAASFQEELEGIRNVLPDIENHRFFSSRLIRCKQLAEALAPDPKRILFDDRLLEMDCGDWENKVWADLPQEAFQHWMKNFVLESAPNGESFLQLYERATDFWDELMLDEAEDVVVVSHSGVLHAIVAHLLEIPLDHAYDLQFGYGQVIRVDKRHHGRWGIHLLYP